MFSATTLMLEEAYIRDITTVKGAITRFNQMLSETAGDNSDTEDSLDMLHGELGEIAGVEDIPWDVFVTMPPQQIARIVGLEPSHFHNVWAAFNGVK